MSQRFPAIRSKLRYGRLAAVLMLLAMVLASVAPTGVGAGVNAQGLRDVGAPQANQPDKITRPDGARPGIYYIDYGGNPLDPNLYPIDGGIRFYGWNVLNPADGVYNWTDLDNLLATRKAKGLGVGIMLTTYDGSDAGDIRSTPNFVIKQPNAVLPATYKNSASDTNDANQPHYNNYWKKPGYNSNFDLSSHTTGWNLSGSASIVNNAPADPDNLATGYAAMLGGADSATGFIYHSGERIPAMPPGISPAKTVYITARIGIVTTDPNPNDHLTMELYESATKKIGTTTFDINNLSHANNTWKDYEFDVSSIAPEKTIYVRFSVNNDASNATTFYVDNVTLNVRHLIPNYWPDTDAQRTYYKAYNKFVKALGDRYKDNDELQFVAIGAGVYGENQPTQGESYPNYNFDHVVEKYGNLTGDDWVQYVNQLASDYATAFSAGDGSGPARHILTQFAPTYKSSSERQKTTDYAQSIGVGLSNNFLPIDWTQSYRPNNDGFYDPIRRYWNSVPIAFESYTPDLCNPVALYWGLIGGVEKHVDYLRMDSTLFRNSDGSLTANAPYINMWRPYIGKSAQDAPKAWTVMREHRNPTLSNCRPGGLYYQKTGASGGTYPQLGNYNYYMTQVDSITGGKTVPETNDKGTDSRYAKDPTNGAAWPDAGLGNCPTTNTYRTDLFGANYPCFSKPYNPDLPPLVGQDSSYYSYNNIRNWTGAGKEAYVVRRTDQATDNPFMFFKVDDGYMKGDGAKFYRATITVKYFDIGKDSFSVKYDSTTGEKIAGTVTKTGTKQYKTVSFTVNDAKFANRLTGGADFYLDSRDPATDAKDGNEWVHMVEVERLSENSEPATNTPTPTVTVTPSVTPSPTPSTGMVTGMAFHDANGNNRLDAGEPGVAGAEIVLVNSDTNVEAYTTTSGADGSYQFAAVQPGQYTLKEKTAPPGYNKSAYEIMFLVQANVTTSLGTNFPHTLAPVTVTPTPTATATPSVTPKPEDQRRIFLPVMMQQIEMQ